jgi:hypothetical protein
MIPTLFFIFLALFVVGVVFVIINFARGATGRSNSIEGFFMGHLFGGVFAWLMGLGAGITGIIWIVQTVCTHLK